MKKYNVIAVRIDNGEKTYISNTNEPMTHKEACTFLSKVTKYPWRREELEPVECRKI